jgi:hypothetical protein
MENGKKSLMETDEYLKLEIAEELGLIDKIIDGGWKALSSKESGQIGGILSARKRNGNKNTLQKTK